MIATIKFRPADHSDETGDGRPTNADGTPLDTTYSRRRRAANQLGDWRAQLHQRVHAGPRLWLFLYQCDVTNLDYAAASRDAQALACVKAADNFRILAKPLRDMPAGTTFGDLPEKVQEATLELTEPSAP